MAGSSFLSRAWVCSLLAGVGAIAIPSINLAQTAPSNIVPDATLGAESSQVIQNFQGLPIEAIAGGAQRGQNLFHSFSQFNVSAGRGAYFAIQNDAVRNVLTRVTGGNLSDIQGTLGTFRASDGTVRVPGVNLFLINPNGIVFGENASLDIGGSFFATTANAVKLGDAGLFSASQPASSNLLTVDPSAFLFNAIANQNLPEIVVRSRGTNTVFGNTTTGLQVPNGKTLLLLGGNVRVEGGQLTVVGGRIEIGAVSTTGTVGLLPEGKLTFPQEVIRAAVKFSQGSRTLLGNSTSEVGSGIGITAATIQLSGGSVLVIGNASGTTSTARAGDLILDATGLIDLREESAIGNIINFNALGQAGDIILSSKELHVSSGARVTSSTVGKGDAGNIVITATDAVLFDGIGVNSQFPSGASSSAETAGSSGKGGDIRISTNSLRVIGGALLRSDTFGKGDAGNIVISASGAVSFVGTSANGQFPSAATSSTQLGSSGKGGDIRISARSLSLTSGAVLNSSTLGTGNAGNVAISASGPVSFDGTSANGQFPSAVFSFTCSCSSGKGGDIRISAISLSLTGGAQLRSDTFGTGDAGNVAISASGPVSFNGTSADGQFRSAASSSAGQGSSGKGGDVQISADAFSLANGASLNSSTSGTGDAGNVVVLARDVQLNNGTIETTSVDSSGGNIQISAERIRLLGDSDIGTIVLSGDGKGGDITLTAKSIIALDDSDILTFSTGGRGGNITLNTRAFFGQNYRPGNPPPFGGNGRVDINASGTVSGIITLPDTTFIQNSLTQLSQNLIDPNTLLANSCIVRSREQNGSFFVTGSGGLPVRPGDAPPASFPTGEVRSLPNTQSQNNRPWQLGDPIVEPQGIYRLPNGKLVMSRECQTQ